mgnify:CR=1 FL=1
MTDLSWIIHLFFGDLDVQTNYKKFLVFFAHPLAENMTRTSGEKQECSLVQSNCSERQLSRWQHSWRALRGRGDRRKR